MAGTFALNTAGLPNLVDVFCVFHDGTVYNFKAQQSAGTVTTADPRKQATLRAIKLGATPVHTET